MVKKISLAVLVALCGVVSFATDIYYVRMRTVPEVPYAGEDFRFVLEVAASQGCEVEVAGLTGIPNSLNLTVTKTFFDGGTREEKGENGVVMNVRSFISEARVPKSFEFTPETYVHLKVTKRVNNGFFTSWSTNTRIMPLNWDTFKVKELPVDSRPADFSGAVGRFSLSLEATPSEVMPQDIVELKLTLSGTGYLGDAMPELPKLDSSLFKTYPATIAKGDNDQNRITVTQSVIPLSTNAVEIGSATMSFFNASIGVYTNVVTKPIALTFVERKKTEEPAVREVKVDTGVTKPAADEGIDVSKYLQLPRGKSSVETTKATQLRIAPGSTAKVIVMLPAKSSVVPLETERGWIRVKTVGHTGWISAVDAGLD